MPNNQMPSFTDIPDIAKSHPFGLLVGFIVLGVLLIYNGTIKCAIKSIIFTLLNKTIPNCNPESILGARLGQWLIGLLNYEWFIWLLIISGVVLYFYYKNKK